MIKHILVSFISICIFSEKMHTENDTPLENQIIHNKYLAYRGTTDIQKIMLKETIDLQEIISKIPREKEHSTVFKMKMTFLRNANSYRQNLLNKIDKSRGIYKKGIPVVDEKTLLKFDDLKINPKEFK